MFDKKAPRSPPPLLKKNLHFYLLPHQVDTLSFILSPKCSRNIDEDHLIFKSYISDILAPKFTLRGVHTDPLERPL